MLRLSGHREAAQEERHCSAETGCLRKCWSDVAAWFIVLRSEDALDAFAYHGNQNNSSQMLAHVRGHVVVDVHYCFAVCFAVPSIVTGKVGSGDVLEMIDGNLPQVGQKIFVRELEHAHVNLRDRQHVSGK